MAKAKAKAEESISQLLEVSAPNFLTAVFKIRGTAPYCQNKFSHKAKAQMIQQQEKGSTGKSTKKRSAKKFDECYEDAQHRTAEGWHGIPAPGLRAALISACRTTGTVMTRAKLAVFVEADGFDAHDQTPLFRITKGKPSRIDSPVRNDGGTIDIRPRPVWQPGWEAMVRIRYDADMLTAVNVGNLLMRVGLQVGLGEGRADSKKSTGIGWGFFEIVND